eukprot:2811301-Prymnesium_polylepis.2
MYYNARLRAPNAWEVTLEPQLADDAAAIFAEAGLQRAFEELWAGSARQHRVTAGDGRCFLATRVSQSGGAGQWRSDITWISVDDPPTYRALEALWRRTGVPQSFAPVIEHDDCLRLYTAFYVVRTRCVGPYLHTDFGRAVGTSAMVLMTPLEDYATAVDAPEGVGAPDGLPADESARRFQLLYESGAASEFGDAGGAPGAKELRRYVYRRGKAIVFSSRFRHSTEPGCAPDGKPQVYLCFVFGTDRPCHWPAIVQALEYLQSRMICRPDGGVVYNPGAE